MSYDIPRAFHAQSTACEGLGSVFMGRLMALCAERLRSGNAVTDRVLGWQGDPRPQADNVPLRLAGALHALRIEGLALDAVYPPNDVSDDALWSAVKAAFDAHQNRILQWLESAPQTNEVRRAAAILPALALVEERFGTPIELFELGTSGGLNLFADHFCLELPRATMGISTSPVRLSPDWTGPLPPLSLPKIVGRTGVDLNPLDPTRPEDQLRLLAYLWPDQPDRMERTRAAIGIASKNPAQIYCADAGQWLSEQLERPSSVGRVVFHTVARQYFPRATRVAVDAAMIAAAKRATEDAPLVHLSMEADGGKGAAFDLTMWPGGQTHEIARADFHGRWINWTGL